MHRQTLNNRNPMKRRLATALIALAATASFAARPGGTLPSHSAEQPTQPQHTLKLEAEHAADHPNVLIIITDDQGFGDFGFLGNEFVDTPNMDRLAAETARFENFIVHPACSPTRTAFMTGRHHLQAGVWGVGARNAQRPDEVIMPAFFKAAGYQTGYFGKRDGMYTVEKEGWERGIDEGYHVTGYQHKNPRAFTSSGMVELEGWTVDHDVRLTLDYIERMGDRPWWVTTAFILPHLPWIAPDEFVDPYRARGYSEELASVFGCITQVDAALGRLLQGLEDLGQADNTIVVFFSDNGPSFKGLDDPEIERRNPRGMSGHKSTIYEHGIRSPLLVRWPGVVEPGPRPQFARVEDLLPTLIKMAGLNPGSLPAHLPFDGLDITPAVMDPAAPQAERTAFLVTIAGPGSAGTPRGLVNDPMETSVAEQHVALRGPRFKFHNFHNGQTALYDIQNDPGESSDVTSSFPDIAAQYETRLHDRYQEILATGRAFYRPVVKVGRHQRGYNRIWGHWAQTSSDTLRGINFFHIEGFARAGDYAAYHIDVRDPGTYDLVLTGVRLDRANGWRLKLDDSIYEPVSVSAAEVRFQNLPLPDEGSQETVISVSGDAAPGSDAIRLDRLEFQLQQPY